MFRAGWRPFIGWFCGACVGPHYVPQYVPAMVGMRKLRSVEKLGGKAK